MTDERVTTVLLNMLPAVPSLPLTPRGKNKQAKHIFSLNFQLNFWVQFDQSPLPLYAPCYKMEIARAHHPIISSCCLRRETCKAILNVSIIHTKYTRKQLIANMVTQYTTQNTVGTRRLEPVP